MSTNVRPNISTKNKYWIEKHRYYELKHFCLQYPIWKKVYLVLDSLSKKPMDLAGFSKDSSISNPVEKCVEERDLYFDRIKMIEQVALDTDAYLHHYILKAVTEGIAYEHLKARLEIPCSKDAYYELYRRFFWILNKKRN